MFLLQKFNNCKSDVCVGTLLSQSTTSCMVDLSALVRAMCSTHFLGHVQQGKDLEIALSFKSMLSQTDKWINVCIKTQSQVCVGVSARAQ